MSDVNVAVPALGGTINIVTDPSSGSRGGYFKQIRFMGLPEVNFWF